MTRIVLPLPPRQELLRVFELGGNSGLLWKVSVGSHSCPGQRAGKRVSGGWQVGLHGVRYMVHRIIWKMLHDEEPPEVDHRDLDEYHNAPSNLRAATASQNGVNRSVRPDSHTGIKGVGIYGSKYGARIRVNGRLEGLGLYDTIEEAKTVFDAAATRLHGEFARSE